MQYQWYRDFLLSEIIRTQMVQENIVLTDPPTPNAIQAEVQEALGFSSNLCYLWI